MLHLARAAGFAILAIGCCFSSAIEVSAEVRLPNVFADHMVLQRDRDLTVWGWADPGEEVSLSIAGQKVSTKANDKGEWSAKLAPLKTGKPLELSVKGTNEIKLSDILVGDVWLCSGQSNMEWSVTRSDNAKEEIANADWPEIRLFHVKKVPQYEPQAEVVLTSSWQPCTPQTIPGFTAVGYFFGRKLHQELDIPIGLINTSWGGTRIEPWTPPEGFAQVESLEEIPNRIDPTKKINQGVPTVLYNGMVHGLVPFGVKGAIWYQGEANRRDRMVYRDKMEALIKGWRTVFDQGDFPFYFVQLAPYHYREEDPAILAEMWEAQEAALGINNTGMAVTTDIGNVNDIHPTNKQDVGLRLALWALAKDYGQDVEFSGPVYREMKVEGSEIRLYFDHAKGLSSRDGQDLSWFTIAGEDGKFVPAKAVIDNETVLVSSPEVPQPKQVRFGWSKIAEPNLKNGAGLPASAFRTDKPKSSSPRN